MSVEDLASRHCEPCHGGTPRVTGAVLARYAALLHGWRVVDEARLQRRFPQPDFATGLALVNRIAAIAEREGHHPDLTLAWGRVDVELWTHAIGGLSEADFILAAKIDETACAPPSSPP